MVGLYTGLLPLTCETRIVNPLPVPPIFTALADNTSPTTYPLPLVVTVTENTPAPETTTVALAPVPVPPVSGTDVYVQFVYKVPATSVFVAVMPFKV